MDTLNPVIVAAAACLAAGLPLLAFAFTARPGLARQQTLRNLNREFHGKTSPEEAGELGGGGIVALARLLTPVAVVRWTDKLLSRAGRPAAWPLERVIVTKIVLSAVAAVVGILLAMSDPSLRTVFIAICLTALGWAAPELLLYSRGQERRQAIQNKLPDAMDQLSIAVEAGLGFESALAHVARNTEGPLSEELIRTLQDIQVGRPRRFAYIDLAERTQVRDLGRFVRAINQAGINGISIGKVLSSQAREMRIKRRQRAEEKAMKLPVKIVFPLVLFILPALFIVILGPAVLNLMEFFS